METTNTKTTARDFFLNLGMIVALYTVAGSIINLLFTVIDKAYKPIVDSYYYGYASSYSISFPVATIIIFFPIFILLAWILGKDFAKSPEKKNLGIHKWLVYITLFVTGLAFAGDLVAVLYAFLNGNDLTTAFILKALVVLVITGLIFFYYISDVRRSLSSKERLIWRIVASVLVLGSIIWGFAVIGSPRTQQLLRYDEQKVSSLQSIDNMVRSYYYNHQALPTDLAALASDNSYTTAPNDQQTGQPFEYRKVSATTFELCATFNKSSVDAMQSSAYPVRDSTYGPQLYKHPAGYYCFSQTVTPNSSAMMVPKPMLLLE